MAEIEGQISEVPVAVETAPLAEAPAPVTELPVTEEAPVEPVTEEIPAEPVVEDVPAAAVEEVPAEPAIEPEAAPAAEAAPAELPTYEAFDLPEGISLADEDLSELTTVFGKYGLTQEAAQDLATFGAERIKRGVEQAQEAMAQSQQDVFNQTRQGWVKEFERQAGNQRNTILNDAKAAIKDAVPDEKQRAALWDVLAYTGAGDHPAVINLLSAIGKRNREGKAPGPSIATTISGNPADRRYQRGQ